MIRLKFTAAAALLIALATIPDQAQAHRYHHGYGYRLPYPISYSHNYGPGPMPGTFAYYDGPSTNHCMQSSAAYRAQVARGLLQRFFLESQGQPARLVREVA